MICLLLVYLGPLLASIPPHAPSSSTHTDNTEHPQLALLRPFQPDIHTAHTHTHKQVDFPQTRALVLSNRQHHAEPGVLSEVEVARPGWGQPVHQECLYPHVSQHGGNGCCHNLLPGNATQGPPTCLWPPHAVSWGSGKFEKVHLSESG